MCDAACSGFGWTRHLTCATLSKRYSPAQSELIPHTRLLIQPVHPHPPVPCAAPPHPCLVPSSPHPCPVPAPPHPCVVNSQLPYTYTGADFYALCTDAMLNGIKRKIAGLQADFGTPLLPARTTERWPPNADSASFYCCAEPLRAARPTLTMERDLADLPADTLAVQLVHADFATAAAQLVPSVSAAELEHYRRVQQGFAPTASDEGADKAKTDRKGKGRATFDD